VEPRAGLDDVEKRKFLTLLGLELRPLGRPARSQSLYRLHYFVLTHNYKHNMKLRLQIPAPFPTNLFLIAAVTEGTYYAHHISRV
jgi:hypothetical protein